MDLPKQVRDAIESDIRKEVLNHLGGLDFKGDLKVSGRLGPETQGIWAEFIVSKPMPGGPKPGPRPGP